MDSDIFSDTVDVWDEVLVQLKKKTIKLAP